METDGGYHWVRGIIRWRLMVVGDNQVETDGGYHWVRGIIRWRLMVVIIG